MCTSGQETASRAGLAARAARTAVPTVPPVSTTCAVPRAAWASTSRVTSRAATEAASRSASRWTTTTGEALTAAPSSTSSWLRSSWRGLLGRSSWRRGLLGAAARRPGSPWRSRPPCGSARRASRLASASDFASPAATASAAVTERPASSRASPRCSVGRVRLVLVEPAQLLREALGEVAARQGDPPVRLPGLGERRDGAVRADQVDGAAAPFEADAGHARSRPWCAPASPGSAAPRPARRRAGPCWGCPTHRSR